MQAGSISAKFSFFKTALLFFEKISNVKTIFVVLIESFMGIGLELDINYRFVFNEFFKSVYRIYWIFFMKLDIFCLGILLERNYSGYEIHKVINTALAHLRQASFGALYPALNRLQAKEFILCETGPKDYLNDGLGKRIFAITDKGRVHFKEEIKKITAAELVNSDFLTALHFSNNLTSNEVSTLVDERLADLQKEQRRLLKLPVSDIPEGQRFAIRYTLGQLSAGIAFLKGEGRAIQTLMAKQR